MNTLIAGNWKMNGTQAEAVALAIAVASGWSTAKRAGVDLALFPPMIHLRDVVTAVAGAPGGDDIVVGAQHMHDAESGAFTGETSPTMIVDAGATAVLLGHSERRQSFGENDAALHRKVAAASERGLLPILCIGETEAEEEDGLTDAVLDTQLRGALDGLDSLPQLVVAYEPVWAIGTGRTATEDTIARVHASIRGRLVALLGGAGVDVSILYGGSVKPANAGNILRVPDVNGVLVGGASLDAPSFLAIAAAASDR